jgi:hypothetical protein
VLGITGDSTVAGTSASIVPRTERENRRSVHYTLHRSKNILPAVNFGWAGPGLRWLKSFEEHLPIIIAGVLRLRAIRRPLCDRSARRFAQDDGFVGGEKLSVSCIENTKDQKKSQALRMTLLWEL